MDKPVIIWIEDDMSSVINLIEYCEDSGYQVEVASQPHAALNLIDQYADRVVLFVVDVMLYGVNDLDSISIENADTKTGLRAGWLIIDRVLRSSQHGFDVDICKIPIVILSTKKMFEDDKNEVEYLVSKIPNSGSIHYISKREMNDDIEFIAQYKFKSIIDSL